MKLVKEVGLVFSTGKVIEPNCNIVGLQSGTLKVFGGYDEGNLDKNLEFRGKNRVGKVYDFTVGSL